MAGPKQQKMICHDWWLCSVTINLIHLPTQYQPHAMSSKPSTSHSTHESEIVGSGQGCHLAEDVGPLETFGDLVVNAAEAPLLKGKTHIPTVRSMVTSKGKVPIQTA